MGEPTTTLAVLFADLGGSTRLYDTLGDAAAQRVTAHCLALIGDVAARHQGRVIKTIGDEVMATFPSAEHAARAGLDILAAVRAARAVHEGRLGVHVGYQFGPVVPEEGDVFGDAVNVAARMVSLAVDGEVLTTRAGIASLSADLAQRARRIDRRAVDGRRGVLEVFQLVEESPDRTTVTEIPAHLRASPGRLVLEFGGQRWQVDALHPSFTIGRAPENDLALGDPQISRRHARIKLRHGKFVLFDESSNGTWVRRDDGKLVHLHREDLILPAGGSLGLSDVQGPDPRDLPIRFRVEGA